MSHRTPLPWALPLVLGLLGPPVAPADAGAGEGPQVPIALAHGQGGRLWVALRDARQVAEVDVPARRVVRRVALPVRPAALAVLGDGGAGSLLVGGMGGELVAVRDGVASLLPCPKGRGPVRVAGLGGETAAVVSLWDESLRVIDVRSGRVTRSIPLGFPPGPLRAGPGGRLVVAGAFGGELAVVDPETGRVRTGNLDAVNLHALALTPDGKELLIGHMVQYGTVPVTGTNIDWGLVLSSRLSAVPLSAFEGDAATTSPLHRRRLTLDGSDHGAADPAALAVSADGATVLIALAGAHQLLKVDRRLGPTGPGAAESLPLGDSLRLEAVEVGLNPVDVVLDTDGTSAVTADAMADTLTVVRVADLSVAATIPLGNGPVARTPAQRGEAAFLDGRHALDRWMSCASCHPRGHTNALNFDTLGDGSYGAAKNTPTLLGAGPTAPYAWTGRFPTLEAQVHQSLQTSLRGPLAEDRTASDIAAYLRTLPPPPPRRAADDPAALRGAAVFEARRCQSCHRPPSFTSNGVNRVGLDDGTAGHAAFNPPALRGVGWTAPYFHDGRAATLDDVLSTHAPGAPGPPDAGQRRDLKAYLESL